MVYKKPQDERRVNKVQVRLTDEEKAQLKAEADKQHLPLAAYMRTKLLSANV